MQNQPTSSSNLPGGDFLAGSNGDQHLKLTGDLDPNDPVVVTEGAALNPSSAKQDTPPGSSRTRSSSTHSVLTEEGPSTQVPQQSSDIEHQSGAAVPAAVNPLQPAASTPLAPSLLATPAQEGFAPLTETERAAIMFFRENLLLGAATQPILRFSSSSNPASSSHADLRAPIAGQAAGEEADLLFNAMIQLIEETVKKAKSKSSDFLDEIAITSGGSVSKDQLTLFHYNVLHGGNSTQDQINQYKTAFNFIPKETRVEIIRNSLNLSLKLNPR